MIRRFFTTVIFLGLLLEFALAKNYDPDQCLKDLHMANSTMQPLNNFGQPTTRDQGTAVSYHDCVAHCGESGKRFQWAVFSQQFSAWLLPWLALISQLPYGSQYSKQDFVAMLLTIGSPTLGAYSLILTVLNGAYVAHRFSRIAYPNTHEAVRILMGLQQAPLRISTQRALLASLVVLPDNNQWWTRMLKAIEYEHTWSLTSISQIAWVIVAYVLTVLQSMSSIPEEINAHGQGVGSLWMWLLPIVIGWLQISPKCDNNRLETAFHDTNDHVYVATANSSEPVRSRGRERAFMLFTEEEATSPDEVATAPIYNYARAIRWTRNVERVAAAFQCASDHARELCPVDDSSLWIDRAEGLVDPANRRGNIEQVINYCRQAPFAFGEGATKGDTVSLATSAMGVALPIGGSISRYSVRPELPTNVVTLTHGGLFTRMLVASIGAIALQWGTVGGAMIIVWFTPTTGLGCRSGAYLVYAAASTLIWLTMVTSSVLAQHNNNAAAKIIATFLRRLAKIAATVNATWVIVICIFQFSNFYDNCFCDSSVFGRGRDNSYNVLMLPEEDLGDIKTAWYGGVGLSAGAAILFVFFVQFYVNPPLPRRQ